MSPRGPLDCWAQSKRGQQIMSQTADESARSTEHPTCPFGTHYCWGPSSGGDTDSHQCTRCFLVTLDWVAEYRVWTSDFTHFGGRR